MLYSAPDYLLGTRIPKKQQGTRNTFPYKFSGIFGWSGWLGISVKTYLRGVVTWPLNSAAFP